MASNAENVATSIHHVQPTSFFSRCKLNWYFSALDILALCQQRFFCPIHISFVQKFRQIKWTWRG